MIRSILTALLCIFLGAFNGFAQQDPQAKKILDAFSDKTKSYPSYSADFEIVMENKQNGEKQENKGNITIKGNKYKMLINKTEVYCNGKDIYNYDTQSNEVSIAKPAKKNDDSFLNDPSKLFSIYTKDYKFRYIGETNENGHNSYEVDLYPIDINKKYSIIKLVIEKEKYQLLMAKVIMKSGVTYVLTLTSFNSNASAVDKDFTFNPKKYKDIEVVDLR